MKIRNLTLTSALAIVLGTAAAAQMTQPSPPTTGPATTQTTTTQTQPTTPTEPTTTQTTTTQTQPATTTEPAATTTQTTTTQTGQVTLATEADIKAGVSVYDEKGELVGKVDSVTASGAIVDTGKARAEIPLTSFGKNDAGLVISITKAELDAKAKETKKEDKPKD